MSLSSDIESLVHSNRYSVDPRNMEATEEKNKPNTFISIEFEDDHYFKRYDDVYNLHMALDYVMFRIRGGAPNENFPALSKKDVEIPQLNKIKFYWDGLPILNFHQRIIIPLQDGLSTFADKSGDTFLDTLNLIDTGGVRGVVPRAALLIQDPNHAHVLASISRNKRAFSTIMAYINSQSWFYKECHKMCDGDGITAFRFMKNFGNIIIPPRIKQAREHYWQTMTMETLRIPSDIKGYFTWTNLVMVAADQLNKSGVQQLEKFCMGLPTWFNTEIHAMRHSKDPSLIFPATYAAILPGGVNAAVAHPFAGEPSILLYAKCWLPDWCIKSSLAKNEAIFELSVCIDSENDQSDSAFLLHHSRIGDSTSCNTCGGKGHGSETELPDGNKVMCPTLILRKGGGTNAGTKNSSDKKQLFAHIVDTDTDDTNAYFTALQEQNAVLQATVNKFTRLNKNKNRKMPVQTAHEADTGSDEEGDDDAHSDTSGGSVLESMAQLAIPNSPKKKLFNKKRY